MFDFAYDSIPDIDAADNLYLEVDKRLVIPTDVRISVTITSTDRGIETAEIVWDSRIGIRVGTERHWRATVKGHKSVSGKRT